MSKEKDILMTYEKERLADLILYLMEGLEEQEKTRFISKYIDPKLALESINAGSLEVFLNKINEFSKRCLNGDYYVEPEYNDYWDSYNEEVFEGCEWAENFSKYLNLSIMYSRNSDYNIAFESFEQLLNCIHEAGFDEEILGTESPEDYIEVDWDDVFDQYYICIKNCIKDRVQMINKAFEVWLNFGERCTAHILNHIEDLPLMEKIIREKIEEFNDWEMQHLFYDLLKKFYQKYDNEFDGVKLAESFLKYNLNFYADIVKAYLQQKGWEMALETINTAYPRVEMEAVKIFLRETLVECYENLGRFEEAFVNAKELFYWKPSYEYYKRARYFSEKVNKLNEFINEAAKTISRKKDYYIPRLLIQILSYEGLMEKLIQTIEESTDYNRYDQLKYGARSLVYRALSNENTGLENIEDFIKKIEEERVEGIADMKIQPEDIDRREFYLNAAVSILKEMVEFHIEAAKRTRYEKAAYYCSVIKDILAFLKQEQKFNLYYEELISVNKRRPALRDEMKKKIGR